MRYSTAQQGSVFIIRHEDGDFIHEKIERLAKTQNITVTSLIVLGGADMDSMLIGGPEHGRALPVVPLAHHLADVHEVSSTGTIFPDKKRQSRFTYLHGKRLH